MSPLVRTWLAARLPDWADHAFHLFHPSVNAVWDDWIRDWERRHGTPAIAATARIAKPRELGRRARRTR